MAKVDIPTSVSQQPAGSRGGALIAKHVGSSDALAKAVGATLEGLTFYEFAHVVAADTRVKVTFEDLGRRKKAELAKLEAVAGKAAKEVSVRPGIFPLDSVSKAECYVCGHIVETGQMPEQCPKCGTARYTFEKEISLAKAWEIAGEAARKSAAFFRELKSQAGPDGKSVLDELAKMEDALATEAGQELAELRG